MILTPHAWVSSVVLLSLTTHAVAEKFNPLHHAGPASPYFDAPVQPGLEAGTPDGCVVDQAAYIVRHGARYPEPGSYAGWLALFSKFQNASYVAKGPLSFIPSWMPPIDDQPHQPLYLSATGAGEAFDLGVQLRKRYGFTKGGAGLSVWSAGQQRVLDTATYFVNGYLSQGNYLTSPTLNRGMIISLPDSTAGAPYADSLTPSSSCPAYAQGDTGSAKGNAFRAGWQQGVADRLNKYLQGGLVLNTTDIGPMMDLCGFGSEVSGDTRFCDIFTESEWLKYEYAHDLKYYYGAGPGNPLAATVGYPWVKAITDLFEAGPGKTVPGGTRVPEPLIMSFTHDNDLPPILSALGLWNTSSDKSMYPLSPTTPNPKRTFRSSHVVAFRGYVALERLACSPVTQAQEAEHGVQHVANVLGGSLAGHASSAHNSSKSTSVKTKSYVRIRADNAPVPIPACSSGPGASCPLDQFAKYVAQRKSVAGDFGERCGLGKDIEGSVRFFTEEGDGEKVSVGC